MMKSIQCPPVIRYNEFTLYQTMYMRFCLSCTAYVRTYIRMYVCCECSGYSVALRTVHTYIRICIRMYVCKFTRVNCLCHTYTETCGPLNGPTNHSL